ncbi:MAG: peptidoglycan DD-metalloendopeptidase family protein [Melioribacter sp.]|uniref:peptidoglycan DD-metalloendopeptidase family protein n=1 Tax=Melioribacter sp. TaxID=2052167 RepID=UPI003BC936C2
MLKTTRILIALLCAGIIFSACSQKTEKTQNVKHKKNSYGIVADTFEVVSGKVKAGQTVTDLLAPYADYSLIHKMREASRGIFSLRSIKVGNTYNIYLNKDSLNTPKYFVYDEDMINYVVFEFGDSIKVTKGEKEKYVELKVAESGIVNSLYETLDKKNLSVDLAIKLSDIYAWQIDFFRIQPSDSFKVYYETIYVDSQYVGTGKILAARFFHRGTEFNAFYFEGEKEAGYYDEEGNSLRKAFLKAPLKFSRISSRYSSRRLHPILGRVKAHLGTDYAAPIGTPIMSVGDGVVIAAGYTRGNGNYVKIKHNSVYTTQYLHMSRFAKGIRKGVYVKQGQVIGYVGKTGLATGPHVCFRFWKNGRQVDPFREKIPPSKGISEENRAKFDSLKIAYLNALDPGAI